MAEEEEDRESEKEESEDYGFLDDED